MLSRLFRRLLVEALEHAFDNGELHFFSGLEPLAGAARFAAHLDEARAKEWVVYAKPPFGGPIQVLEYLGRYTHRVAIANQRLLSIDKGQVEFRWKDYKHEQRPKRMIVAAEEFIRRFLLHTLPAGFQRIRHYGFLSNTQRRAGLDVCRRLLATPVSELLPKPRRDWRDLYLALTGRPVDRCPHCGIGVLMVIEVLPPQPYRRPALEDST